jgi:hypothetical protein
MAILVLGAATGASEIMHGAISSVKATSGIRGEIDVEPEMRPWHPYDASYPANPQSWWCEMPNCTTDFQNNGQGPLPTIQRELQAIHNTGAAYVGFGIAWPLVESASGVYDWTRLDEIMSAIEQAGLTPQPDIVWTPQWAGGGSQFNNPPPPSDIAAFGTAVATRYDGRLPSIEIWSEPDGGRTLATWSAATYVNDILNPAYAAIKAVDPKIQVMMAGSSNDAGGAPYDTYLASIIAAGGEFDLADFHNYAGTYAQEAQAYRSELDATNRGGVPIWMNEFGVQSSQGNQSAAIQQVFGGSLPLQVAAWYNLRDTGAWNCCPPAEVNSATWGLLNSDFTTKTSYGTLSSLLGGAGGYAPPQPASSTPPGPQRTAGPAKSTGPPTPEPMVVVSPTVIGTGAPPATASPMPIVSTPTPPHRKPGDPQKSGPLTVPIWLLVVSGLVMVASAGTVTVLCGRRYLGWRFPSAFRRADR